MPTVITAPLPPAAVRAGLVFIAAALLPAAVRAAPEGGAADEVDWRSVGLHFAAALALFLWAIRALSQRLREVAGDRLRDVLHRGIGNRFAGLAAGTGATFVLDSSSATIILLIALVDAGVVNFAAALPVILGSNIGTTLSSQLFAWDAEALPPLLLASGLVMSVVRRDTLRTWGPVVFHMGLVLFALDAIGAAMDPLKESDVVQTWLRRFDAPLLGVAAGAAATVAIQSSSAMMGIVIALASQQLISLEAGVAMMLGAEIGTCADTLIATVGRSAAAVRAGLFHFLFNLLGAAAGLALIDPLVALARASSGALPQQIANAHVGFNVLGALVFIGFTGAAARGLARWIPDRTDASLPAGAAVRGASGAA